MVVGEVEGATLATGIWVGRSDVTSDDGTWESTNEGFSEDDKDGRLLGSSLDSEGTALEGDNEWSGVSSDVVGI